MRIKNVFVLFMALLSASAFARGFYMSKITPELMERMRGKSLPESAFVNPEFSVKDLRYLRVMHKDLSGETKTGEIIVNKKIAAVTLYIFMELYKASYPIEKIRLIDEYNGVDEDSMRDNNSSAFCYRTIARSNKLSNHALGLAIDINTLYNPYIKKSRNGGADFIQPETAGPYTHRENEFPYKIEKGDLCHTLFTKNGFEWGGEWDSVKDYQHFEWVGKPQKQRKNRDSQK